MGKLLHFNAHCIWSVEPFRNTSSLWLGREQSQISAPSTQSLFNGTCCWGGHWWHRDSSITSKQQAPSHPPNASLGRNKANCCFPVSSRALSKIIEWLSLEKTFKIMKSNQVLQRMFNIKFMQDSVKYNCLFSCLSVAQAPDTFAVCAIPFWPAFLSMLAQPHSAPAAKFHSCF